jgi:hypothetical protein
MSNFSNNTPTSTLKSTYQKHHVYEVSGSLTESKHIADNYANANRYQHRAEVLVVGDSTIRPYDPIYLDGLPNGMSGYWTVLSVRHVFGGTPASYMLRLEVGTDVIGDIDPNAANRSNLRDVQSDLAGQSLTSSGAQLTQYSLSPNASPIEPLTSASDPTAVVNPSPVAVPTIAGITPNKDHAPNLKNVKRTVQWTAKSNGKVLK